VTSAAKHADEIATHRQDAGLTNVGMDEAIRRIVAREKGEYDEMTVACGYCRWNFIGTNEAALSALASHREGAHPGEWEKFQKKHRQRQNPLTLQWPRERCLQYMRDLTIKLGRRPVQDDLKGATTPDRPNSGLIAKQCRGWKRACDDAAAMITTGPPTKEEVEEEMGTQYTDEECIAAGVRWMREHGKSPTASEWMQPTSVRGDYPSRDGAMAIKSSRVRPWKTWKEFRGAIESRCALETGTALCTSCEQRPKSTMATVLYEGLCIQCREEMVKSDMARKQMKPQPLIDALNDEIVPVVEVLRDHPAFGDPANGADALDDVAAFERLVQRAKEQSTAIIRLRKALAETQEKMRNHPFMKDAS
jgi:hypothetical protein